MKLFISLLLLILSVYPANAEVPLPVSCENVTQISVVQVKLTEEKADSKKVPFLYSIVLWLTPKAAQKYNEIADRSIMLIEQSDGTLVSNNSLHLLTPDGIITGDNLSREYVNSRQIILSFKTPERAFEAAQKVCSNIKPKAFFLYDYFEAKKRRSSKNR